MGDHELPKDDPKDDNKELLEEAQASEESGLDALLQRMRAQNKALRKLLVA